MSAPFGKRSVQMISMRAAAVSMTKISHIEQRAMEIQLEMSHILCLLSLDIFTTLHTRWRTRARVHARMHARVLWTPAKMTSPRTK